MRKSMLIPVIALIFACSALTACTQANKPEPVSGPAFLEGQSEHWKVNVGYTPGSQAMEEVTSVQFLASDIVTEAAVTITHKNQDAMTYHVIEPSQLKEGQTILLSEKGQVKSWKDTEQFIVEWKIGGNQFKEYITPVKKDVPAGPK
jgi:lipoprotein-anchoring transpeptidase ErfK/SrfK